MLAPLFVAALALVLSLCAPRAAFAADAVSAGLAAAQSPVVGLAETDAPSDASSAAAPAEEEIALPAAPTGKGALAPGVYRITSAANAKWAIGLEAAKAKDGLLALIEKSSGKLAQNWVVNVGSDGYATLTNAKTGKLLTVRDGKMRAGNQVWQYGAKANDAKSQRWVIRKHGDSYALHSAKNTKYVLALSDAKAAIDSMVVIKKWSNSATKLFAFSPVQAKLQGTVSLRIGANEGLALAVNNSKTKAGVKLGTSAVSQAMTQRFVVQDVEGGCLLRAVSSGLYLTAKNGVIVQGALKKNHAGQVFVPLDSNGLVVLVEKTSGKALTVKGSVSRAATTVQLAKLTNSAKQRFSVRETAMVGTGTFYVVANANAKATLAMKDGKRVSGVATALAARKNTNLDKFRLASAGNGAFYLKNVATGRVATMLNTQAKRVSSVVMRDQSGDDAQRWRVEFNDDLSLSFVNESNGLALSIAGGKAKAGAVVKARKQTKAAAQRFRLRLTTKNSNERVTIDVPCYMQNPQLPTGCESVACTNALNYWGCGLGKTTVANSYMPYGSDGVYNFIGNPRDSSGWIICAPGITNTANRVLNSRGKSVTAVNATGTKLQDLRKYLDKGQPVIVWTTIGMGSPGGLAMYKHGYPLRSNNHAVVLSGYNPSTGRYLVADSLAGKVWRSGGRFATLYVAMGRQAVVLED